MSWKSLINIAIGSSLFLAACGSTDNTATTVEPVNAAQLARTFADQMSTSMVPIIEVNNPLQTFGDQLARDADNIDDGKIMAFASAMEIIFEDVGGLLAMAITEDASSGKLSSINWALINPTSFSFSPGVSASYNNTNRTLSIVGQAVSSSYDGTSNTATGAFTIYLPATTVVDSTVVLAITGLSFADDSGTRVSTASTRLSLTFGHDFQEDPHTDLVKIWDLANGLAAYSIELVAGQIVLANKIVLNGAGSFSVVQNYDVNENVSLNFDVTGAIQNSLATTFTASASGDFGYQKNYDVEYAEVYQAKLEVNLDLTEANSSRAYMMASLVLDLDYKAVDSNASWSEDLALGVDVELAVDDNNWGMYSDLNYAQSATCTSFDSWDGCTETHTETAEVALAIRDLNITSNVVQLEFYLDSTYDFDANTITVGKITVDGNKQADVQVDAEDGSVYTDFIDGSDVVLISATQVQSLNNDGESVENLF